MGLDVRSLAQDQGGDEASTACPGVQPNAPLHQATQLGHLHIRRLVLLCQALSQPGLMYSLGFFFT